MVIPMIVMIIMVMAMMVAMTMVKNNDCGDDYGGSNEAMMLTI